MKPKEIVVDSKQAGGQARAVWEMNDYRIDCGSEHPPSPSPFPHGGLRCLRPGGEGEPLQGFPLAVSFCLKETLSPANASERVGEGGTECRVGGTQR